MPTQWEEVESPALPSASVVESESDCGASPLPIISLDKDLVRVVLETVEVRAIPG